MLIRHQYDGLQDKISHETALDCSKDKGLTKQSHRDECDINKITRSYERTGNLPQLISANPRYGDFSNVPDYLEAMNTVLHAEAQFRALDAHIRARFENDPAQFLEFATNADNLEEMRRLGLAKPLASDPAPVPISPDPAAPGAPAPQA